jgi:adenosine deaminase
MGETNYADESTRYKTIKEAPAITGRLKLSQIYVNIALIYWVFLPTSHYPQITPHPPMPQHTKKPQVELHSHLGSAVHPSILWSIAHRQGIKLPSKDFWEFEKMITMSGTDKNKDLAEMNRNFFQWTELIQSSPEAIEESVKSTISGGYRKSNITTHELRFNPMLRNRGGERDLDHIIMSSIWGKQKAILEYPQVKAGIILMMHRPHTYQQNQIIINKAIKYMPLGIIGVDVAGPNRKDFNIKEYKDLFMQAREAGLKVTIHTGEENQLQEMKYVVREIQPDRIGHGVECVKDNTLMKELVEKNILLEICPTSNLRNNVIKSVPLLKSTIRTLLNNKVKFAICTDGPEMYRTNIAKEHQFLLDNKIMTQKELDQSTSWGLEASFIK